MVTEAREVAPYKMSFSTGGLFINESIAIAAMRDNCNSWETVKTLARESGLVPFRKSSSATRSIREIVNRLRHLKPHELHLLQQGERHEQAALLWLAVCRAYRLVAEFATEVLSERFLSYRLDIELSDFDAFLSRKAEWHPELDTLTASTRGKVRQILFRMMKEASIISEQGRILPALLTPRVASMIRNTDPTEFRFFPGASRLTEVNAT